MKCFPLALSSFSILQVKSKQKVLSSLLCKPSVEISKGAKSFTKQEEFALLSSPRRITDAEAQGRKHIYSPFLLYSTFHIHCLNNTSSTPVKCINIIPILWFGWVTCLEPFHELLAHRLQPLHWTNSDPIMPCAQWHLFYFDNIQISHQCNLLT